MRLPARLLFLCMLSALAAPASAQIAVEGGFALERPDPRCTNLQLQKQVPCPDSTLFFWEGTGAVEELFNSSDFKGLDALFQSWSSGKARFPDGQWKLAFYYDALDGNVTAWNDWPGHLRKVQKWQAATQNSVASRMAEAAYWRSYAWKARGENAARYVPKESWQLFHQRLEKANAILDSLADMRANLPAWYSSKIRVMIDMGQEQDEVHKVFREGVARFPEYHGIYFTMARGYEPRWGGSPREYEAFAREAAELAKNFEGPGMYARLYWLVDYESGMPFDPERSKFPNWPTLRAGFQELARRYPSSMHNLNQYAAVACRSEDSVLYRRLRTMIDGYVNEDSFNLVPVDACDLRHKWIPKPGAQPG